MTSARFKIKRRVTPSSPGGPTLGSLSLTSSSASAGVGGSTIILGATVGSTLTITNSVGGKYSVSYAAPFWFLNWSSAVTAGTDSPVITETLAGAAGSPKNTTVNVTVSAAGTLVIPDPTASTSPYTWLQPTYRDAFVCMSPSVTQNDEAIDVQAVIGTPYSPQATTVTFSGSDTQYFAALTGGKLVFKAAARASVPRSGWLVMTVNASNANGASEACSLWVWVPSSGQTAADGEIFVSFKRGSDSTGDGSPGNPYKYCPGSKQWGGAATTYTGGKTIFFEGIDGIAGDGVPHETYLHQGVVSYRYSLDHHGTSTRQHRYAFHGWRGQARLSGAKSISGTWGAATSGDTYSNPITASLEKATIGFSVYQFQPAFFGDTLGILSQYPRPNVLTVNTDWQAAAHQTNSFNNTTDTSDGGMKGLPIVNVTSSVAPIHLYLPPNVGTYVDGNLTGGMAWVQDAKLDARFNNASVAYNANGIGMWFMVPCVGNNISLWPVLAYDVTTHRAFFKPMSNAITPAVYPGTGIVPCDFGNIDDGAGRQTAYALLGSPYDIRVVSQYGLTGGGATLVAYRPNTNQVRISQLDYGISIGNQSYVTIHQGWCERYSGGALPSGAAQNGGAAIIAYSPGSVKNEVFGMRSHQNYNGNEGPCMFDGYTGTFSQPRFHRFHQTECLRGGGCTFVCDIQGLTTGSGPGGFPTRAEVAAFPGSDRAWWYFPSGSASRSIDYCLRIRGMKDIEHVTRDFDTVHGDVHPWYRDSDGVAGSVSTYNDHNLVMYELADRVVRWRTTSDGDHDVDSSISKSNWFIGCVVLAQQQNGGWGVQMFSGEPGGLFQSGIFMRSPRDVSGLADLACFWGGGGYANMTVQNCIMNGAVMDTTLGQTWSNTPPTWTFQNNGLTANTFPTNDTPNARLTTGTTVLAAQQTWDLTTIPAPWQSILRAGGSVGAVKIGPFHRV